MRYVLLNVEHEKSETHFYTLILRDQYFDTAMYQLHMSEIVVGLDEAGAGPGFGSLWAAAVHLPCDIPGLADSKKLSEKRRNDLRAQLLSSAYYGLGEVTASEIDSWGMAEARRLVFERALDDYVSRNGPSPTRLEVDGTIFRPWSHNGEVIPSHLQPGADALIPCASAASILAKTTRDAQVVEMCDNHPYLQEYYDLRANKGYLSHRHIQGIREHGRSEWHRHSFHIRSL